jgi:hypothetical protein
MRSYFPATAWPPPVHHRRGGSARLSTRRSASLVIGLAVASLAATSLAAMLTTNELLVESVERPPRRTHPPVPHPRLGSANPVQAVPSAAPPRPGHPAGRRPPAASGAAGEPASAPPSRRAERPTVLAVVVQRPPPSRVIVRPPRAVPPRPRRPPPPPQPPPPPPPPRRFTAWPLPPSCRVQAPPPPPDQVLPTGRPCRPDMRYLPWKHLTSEWPGWRARHRWRRGRDSVQADLRRAAPHVPVVGLGGDLCAAERQVVENRTFVRRSA